MPLTATRLPITWDALVMGHTYTFRTRNQVRPIVATGRLVAVYGHALELETPAGNSIVILKAKFAGALEPAATDPLLTLDEAGDLNVDLVVGHLRHAARRAADDRETAFEDGDATLAAWHAGRYDELLRFTALLTGEPAGDMRAVIESTAAVHIH